MCVKILFVCHGNICRSPMAEYLFRDLAKRAGLQGVTCASAALHTDEIGSGVHRGTQRILDGLGIDCRAHRAALMQAGAGEEYDYILGMDRYNLKDLHFRLGSRAGRAHVGLLGDYATPPIPEIEDPWYTGDFARTYSQVRAACEGLVAALRKQR